jgi:hypothetical protein
MNECVHHRSDVLLRAMFAIGLLLTIGLFSGYRPWGESPVNFAFLLGPFVLAAATASHLARSGEAAKTGRERTRAARLVGLGLVMLLAGACPWLYTPLLTRDPITPSNQAAGTLEAKIFALIGLPGLAVTAIGLINLAPQRRARKAQKPSPNVGGLEE